MTDNLKQPPAGDGVLREHDVEGFLRLLGSQIDPEVPVSDAEADVLLRLGHLMQPSEEDVAARIERILSRRRMETVDIPEEVAEPVGQPVNQVLTPKAVPSTPAGGEPQAVSRSFLTLLQDETDLETADLVERLGPEVTAAFLVATMRQPDLFPPGVRSDLAARAERCLQVPSTRSLGSFEYLPALQQRAASRKRALGPEPQSFRELLTRCGMTPEIQAYWIALAEEG